MLHDFQLQTDPFGVAADPKFLYFTTEHLEIIASLFHTVFEARGFAAVIAPPGMGKTTLLHYFRQMMARRAETMLLDSSFQDRKDMLLSILAAFGVLHSSSYS